MARTRFNNVSNVEIRGRGLGEHLPKKRKCNQINCTGRMRPTRYLNTQNTQLRIFRCCVCGKENPWLDDPLLDGSHGELHKLKNGEGHSGLSMLSDPIFYPPKKTRTK